MIALKFARLVAVVLILGLFSGEVLASGAAPPDDGHAGAGQGGDNVGYLELDALTVTIFRNDAPAGQLTTRLVLQMASVEASDVVRAAQVKLRDAMLRELHSMLEREARNGPKVDLDLVKARMLKVTRRQLGPDIVADVLVQALLRRGA